MIIWRRMVVPKYGMYREFEIHTMITQDDYIPIATATELDNLRNATAQTFGAGSKWEGTYTSGLDKKYVLIDDIDLGVAPYNEGAGWLPIDSFTGIFDMAGRFVTDLFIDTTSNYQGLFGNCPDGKFKNGFVSGFIKGTKYLGLIVARCLEEVTQCGVSGAIFSSLASGANSFIGGAFGAKGGLTKNISSFACLAAAGNDVGGLIGRGAGAFEKSFSVGSVRGGANAGGLIGNNVGVAIVASYYNTTTSGQSDTGKGVPKTTAELLALAPEEWDTAIWQFKADRYPIQRIFGEQAIHRAPPLQPTATIDGGNIVLDWADAPSEVDLPDGYFVFQSFAEWDAVEEAFIPGPWTKLNATAVTDKTYTVTGPLDAGEYNYFITAYYNLEAYKIKETGNSATTTETIA